MALRPGCGLIKPSFLGQGAASSFVAGQVYNKILGLVRFLISAGALYPTAGPWRQEVFKQTHFSATSSLKKTMEEVLRILDALQFHEKSVKDGDERVCPAGWKLSLVDVRTQSEAPKER